MDWFNSIASYHVYFSSVPFGVISSACNVFPFADRTTTTESMNLFKTSCYKKKKNTLLLRLPDVSALSAVRKEYHNVSPFQK